MTSSRSPTIHESSRRDAAAKVRPWVAASDSMASTGSAITRRAAVSAAVPWGPGIVAMTVISCVDGSRRRRSGARGHSQSSRTRTRFIGARPRWNRSTSSRASKGGADVVERARGGDGGGRVQRRRWVGRRRHPCPERHESTTTTSTTTSITTTARATIEVSPTRRPRWRSGADAASLVTPSLHVLWGGGGGVPIDRLDRTSRGVDVVTVPDTTVDVSMVSAAGVDSPTHVPDAAGSSTPGCGPDATGHVRVRPLGPAGPKHVGLFVVPAAGGDLSVAFEWDTPRTGPTNVPAATTRCSPTTTGRSTATGSS